MPLRKSLVTTIGQFQKTKYVWISDFVYGGIDGAVTTFAVVAGVHGAQLSTAIVLILGFANLFADGFSMAVGKYSSDKAELERISKVKRLEYTAVEHHADRERNKVTQMLQTQGFTGSHLTDATNVITGNKDVWVEMIMRNEHHVYDERIYPVRSALTTFVAFNIVGLIPLLSYLLRPVIPHDDLYIFYVTSILTLVALFIVGAIKSRFTDQAWWWSGLGTMLLGGVAATIAYLVGFALRGLV